MKIAVDVCIGPAGVALLRSMGFDVVCTARHCEADRDWFARGIARGAEVFISPDVDIEILAYDANVEFFRARSGVRDTGVVAEFMGWMNKPRGVRRREMRSRNHAD